MHNLTKLYKTIQHFAANLTTVYTTFYKTSQKLYKAVHNFKKLRTPYTTWQQSTQLLQNYRNYTQLHKTSHNFTNLSIILQRGQHTYSKTIHNFKQKSTAVYTTFYKQTNTQNFTKPHTILHKLLQTTKTCTQTLQTKSSTKLATNFTTLYKTLQHFFFFTQHLQNFTTP